MPKRHAEIAGAGFAGLVAATALGRRGWSVRVHEANAQLREFGAGLFLWGNGLTVLEEIGVYDELARGAHAAPSWDVRVDGGLRSQEVTNAPGGIRMLTMRRQHLYAIVLRAAQQAGAEVVANSRAVAASPEGVLHLADGRQLKGDLVIGADGVRSSIRASLPIRQERKKYHHGIIRVLTSRRGQVGGEADHIIDYWSYRQKTLRVLYVPCDPETLYFAMMAPSDDPEASAIPIRTDIWGDHLPELAPFLSEVGERGRYDVYESTVMDTWSLGRAALVGDSGWAMPPTLGQGAGFAMMNAYTMAVALDEATTIEEGLRLWEKRERPLTDETQQRSIEFAELGGRRVNLSVSDMNLRAQQHIPTGIQR